MTHIRLFTALGAAVLLAGCGSDSLGVDARNAGTLAVHLREAPSALIVDGALFSTQAREDVAEVLVTVTAVAALRAGANEDDESRWVRVPVDPAVTIDLMNLPTNPGSALLLNRGALSAGSYRNLRLHVSDATIEFARDVNVGPRTWVMGVQHPLRIPGPADTRIMIPGASFQIVEGEETGIDLVLQAGTSVQSIAATPNFVLMAPVLLANRRP